MQTIPQDLLEAVLVVGLHPNNPVNHPHQCFWLLPALHEISLLLPTVKPDSQLVGSLTHSLHHMPYSATVCVQCSMGVERGRSRVSKKLPTNSLKAFSFLLKRLLSEFFFQFLGKYQVSRMF